MKLTEEQLNKYKEDGYLIIRNFNTSEEIDKVTGEMKRLIDELDTPSTISIFTTTEQDRKTDDYFLGSGDKIRYFFENGAIVDGKLAVPKDMAFNKVGHALHNLNPKFEEFSYSSKIHDLIYSIGYKKALSVQSMYIFKGRQIGGYVNIHQDSTFLHTTPLTTHAIWFAFEDSSIENGCLRGLPGSHKDGITKRFVRDFENGGCKFIKDKEDVEYDKNQFVALECKKGDIILLDGALVHYSEPNLSDKSRHAYTLHFIEGGDDNVVYEKDNWLQSEQPFRALLYKKNEAVDFFERSDLLAYPEREYISKIKYYDYEMLVKYDLPIDGVLKEVSFDNKVLKGIKGEAIPYGVEIIEYCYEDRRSTTPLSTLPSSIHTVRNAVILSIYEKGDENKHLYSIPPNITSISFLKCVNISGFNVGGNGSIIIPNTIKSLEMCNGWDNEGVSIRKNDIPFGVTSLSMIYYPIKKLNEEERILPNTIKYMEILCNPYKETNFNSDGLFNFMPKNIENLYLCCNVNLTPDSNFKNCTSLKELLFDFYTERMAQLNSFPNSITNLEITGYRHNLKMNIIPDSVTNLDVFYINTPKHPNDEDYNHNEEIIPSSVVSLNSNKLITTDGILPKSLTSLSFTINPYFYTTDNIQSMVKVLPKSLTSITLPNSKIFREKNFIFPQSIKHIIILKDEDEEEYEDEEYDDENKD